MSVELVTPATFGLLILLLILGVPLAFAAFATALTIGLATVGGGSIFLITSSIYEMSLSYVMLTVPLFVMMGCMMERAGVADRLFHVLHIWTARLPGGIGVGAVLAGAVMAAMVGIVGADVITLGIVALPAMLKRRYDRRLCLGIIAASGSLGAMIPPSLVLIFYGLIAGESISQLFAAALIPGLMMAAMYIAYIILLAWRLPHLAPPPDESLGPMSVREHLSLCAHLIGPAAIIFLVLGTIYTGVAAPAEAAALGAAGSMAVAAIEGKLSLTVIASVIRQTGQIMAPIVWIVFGSSALIAVYNISGGMRQLTSFVSGLPLDGFGILVVIICIFILLGAVIDWIGIALLTLPIFLPIITDFGYDPIWFGVIFCISVQIAYLSPPFGPACFYLKSVAPPDVELTEIFRATIPFVGLQVLALGIVIAWPDLALWLPGVIR